MNQNVATPLQELNIAWRKDDGGFVGGSIDELFDDEDVENQFIPQPIQGRNQTNLLGDEIKQYASTTRLKKKKPTRNRTNAVKSKSLLRPTPVKDYKIVKDEAESEEDIISEMRCLTVRPIDKESQSKSFVSKNNTARMRSTGLEVQNDVQVSGVSMKTKRKLLRWLEEINLIRRKAVSIEAFPQFCRNGVIFFDLVNKLNGRTPILNGIQRNPKNITCITANYSKVLSHLRTLPKMNARYLWAENQMMEGNSDVIWGFIDDIWHLHNNKISPFDTARKNKTHISRSLNRSKHYNSSVCSLGKL